MSNTVPVQHPAVVLRSSYQHLRALLAMAAIAIVGLTIAVAVLAMDTTSGKSAASAARIATPAASPSAPAAHAGAAPAVTSNPDELGPRPSTAQPHAPTLRRGPVDSYSGRY
jgi:hypothetical protein